MIANDRHSERHSVILNTQLIMADGTAQQLTMHNLSLNGAYLSASKRPVPLHSLVDLKVKLTQRQFHIQAMVVHNNEAGTGLMFRDPEHSLYRQVSSPLMAPVHRLPLHLQMA